MVTQKTAWPTCKKCGRYPAFAEWADLCDECIGLEMRVCEVCGEVHEARWSDRRSLCAQCSLESIRLFGAVV